MLKSSRPVTNRAGSIRLNESKEQILAPAAPCCRRLGRPSAAWRETARDGCPKQATQRRGPRIGSAPVASRFRNRAPKVNVNRRYVDRPARNVNGRFQRATCSPVLNGVTSRFLVRRVVWLVQQEISERSTCSPSAVCARELLPFEYSQSQKSEFAEDRV